MSARADRIIPNVLGEGAPRILGTVAKHPHLLEPMLKFSSALAAGVLPRRASEILALRAAWNCRSDFEWGHHTRYGLDAGLTQVEVDRLAGGAPDAGWNESDAALVRVRQSAAEVARQAQARRGVEGARPAPLQGVERGAVEPLEA